MPNKNVTIKLTVYSFALSDLALTKESEVESQSSMFEYAGEALDYVALYDRELAKGFAITSIDENSASVSIVYVRDKGGGSIELEELFWAALSGRARERLREQLGQIISGDMSLTFVDSYKDYEGAQVTKLLPMRRGLSL